MFHIFSREEDGVKEEQRAHHEVIRLIKGRIWEYGLETECIWFMVDENICIITVD